MRTKLLLAAATLAAGLASSMAQSNVYSVNVVGYYNLVTPAKGYSFIADQTTNGVNDINTFFTNGVVSSADGSLNTVLYVWKGALTPGYKVYTWFLDADANAAFGASAGNGWYDGNGNLAVDQLKNGAGSFLYNASNGPITNTIAGTVTQGMTAQTVQPGFNALSITPALSTNLDSSLIQFPAASSPDGTLNDVYYKWKGGTAGYSVFTYFVDADANAAFGASAGNGWYDGNGNNQSANPATFPKVGEGFFILHQTPASNWVYSFTVQ